MKISIFKKQAPEAVKEQTDASKIEKTYQIKDEKTVTPRDVVIASIYDIGAIIDYHECKGVYIKSNQAKTI